MAKKSTIGLTAAALMACAGGAASAGTFTTAPQTLSFSPGAPGNFTHVFTFAGFVPAVGQTLTKVTDTITDSFTGKASVTNLDGAGSFSVITNTTASKSLPTVSPVISATVSATNTFGPFTLASGASTSGTISGSKSATFAATSGLAGFEAPTFTATGKFKTTFSVSGTAGSGSSLPTGTIKDKLVFTFTTKAPGVPEPATLSVLGSGLIGLGLARLARRRRKR